MTQFSFEVPITHLSDFSDLQDFNFALSFLAHANASYRYWMTTQPKELWLDNSYNELMRPDKAPLLANLALSMGASYVVCPDDPSWPTSKIRQAYEEVCDLLGRGNTKPVVVVNSPVMQEEMRKYGANTFAAPYRIRMSKPLKWSSWASDCHFLGLVSIQEILTHNPPSCDTSMPIKLAILGKTIDDWSRDGYPHYHTCDMPDFFYRKLSTKEIDLARKNIIRLKEVCNATETAVH
jgi:hypothetical protein